MPFGHNHPLDQVLEVGRSGGGLLSDFVSDFDKVLKIMLQLEDLVAQTFQIFLLAMVCPLPHLLAFLIQAVYLILVLGAIGGQQLVQPAL